MPWSLREMEHKRKKREREENTEKKGEIDSQIGFLTGAISTVYGGNIRVLQQQQWGYVQESLVARVSVYLYSINILNLVVVKVLRFQCLCYD